MAQPLTLFYLLFSWVRCCSKQWLIDFLVALEDMALMVPFTSALKEGSIEQLFRSTDRITLAMSRRVSLLVTLWDCVP